MKRTTCALCAALVLFNPAGALYAAELTYQGKPVSAWVADLTNKESAQARQEAQEAIRSLGTNVVPYLLEELRELGAAWQSNVTNFYQTPALVKRQENLLWAFRTLGPIAQPSVPMLVKHMHIEDNALAADLIAFALVKIDPPAAASVLTGALTNRNHFVRASAANHLYALGTNAALAVPALIACLQDLSSDPNGEAFLRVSAAGTLGAIGKPAEQAVPTLIQVLQYDANGSVRRAAARALAHFEGSAAQAVPALTRVMRDDEAWYVRVAAAGALGEWGTNAAKSLPELYLVSTNDVEQRVRAAVEAAIQKIANRPGDSPQK